MIEVAKNGLEYKINYTFLKKYKKIMDLYIEDVLGQDKRFSLLDDVQENKNSLIKGYIIIGFGSENKDNKSIVNKIDNNFERVKKGENILADYLLIEK